jgi:pilus assembly protein CpaF
VAIPSGTVLENRVEVADADSHEALSESELEWKKRINEKLLSILDLSLIETIGDEKARTEIRQTANHLLAEESVPLSLRQRQRVIKAIEDEVLGLGPLEPLLADKSVSDILVNGYDTIYVERRGKLERTSASFSDQGHLLNTIDRIVSAVGRRIDESSPMVDARLKDGSRWQLMVQRSRFVVSPSNS